MDHKNYEIDELISAKSIAARVESLAKEITSFYSDTEKLIVVGLLRGSFVFIADLAHQAIICKTNIEGNEKIFPLFQDFEGFRLLGPNSLAISTRISTFSFDGI